MRWLFSIKNTIKRSPIKLIFMTCFMMICILAWFGTANLQATENNSDDETETSEVIFQNEAQAQRAENIATQVAAQESEGKTIEDIKEDIYIMRSSGMGWGEIAKYYGLHPSISGLGHFKSNHEHAMQHQWKTELQEATTRSFKGGIAKGHGASGSKTGQNNLGPVHTKNYRKNQEKDTASKHSKDKSNDHGGGHGKGHSGDHGNGRGEGNGGGKK